MKEKWLPTDRKNSSKILIISKNNFWKTVLYYSNLVNRAQSKISDVSFSIEFCFETKVGCFFTRLCTFHIAIRPHILPICNDTRSIVKMVHRIGSWILSLIRPHILPICNDTRSIVEMVHRIGSWILSFRETYQTCLVSNERLFCLVFQSTW